MLPTSNLQRGAIPAALTIMSPARDDPNARSSVSRCRSWRFDARLADHCFGSGGHHSLWGVNREGLLLGTVTFMRYPSGDYDLVIKSAITTITARGDGGKVVKVHGVDDNVATFVVVYPLATTEVYQLTLNAFGHGTLTWAVLKNRAGSLGITRGSVYTATCDR